MPLRLHLPRPHLAHRRLPPPRSVPFDVIKTRLMNQHSHERLYTGAVDCLIKTVRHEGAGALYKGFLPTYSRLAPWQLVFFLCFERLNRLVVGESFAR